MSKSLSAKNIVWSAIIALAFFAVAAIPANAQSYSYQYPGTVPFFGNYNPTPASNSYNSYYGYGNNYGNYYGGSYYYNPISVSCYSSPQSVTTGSYVTWTASASGGTGAYTYSWSGDEGLSGNDRSVYKSYYSPGLKSASVTVNSGGQSVTRSCSNHANVTGYYSYNQYPYNQYQTPSYQYQQYGYQQQAYPYGYSLSNNFGLDIGCYADPANAKIGQPITWIVEVTGGAAPYTYSWTGSDGLTGSQSSVVKYYAKSGSKSAIVSVNSADGKSASRACSNQVTVAGSAPAYRAPVVPYPQPAAVVAAPTPTPAPTSTPVVQNVVASEPFSLAYVPWGWVAVIVILILLATVIYLMFNREKI